MPVSLSTSQIHRSRHWSFVQTLVAGWLALAVLGCGSTMQKLGTEQLLLSEAVDTAVGQIDFSSLAGRRVFLDRSFLQTMQTNNIVDANYIVSALRQQMAAAKCLIQENRDDAEIIVEPRVGSLGTDGHDVVYGVPQTTALSAAASAVSRIPLPPVPEVSFGRINANLGVAKIAVFAYDRETREPVWQSGNSRAESSARNTWIFGIGPIQRGTIYKGYAFAGSKIDGGSKDEEVTTAPEHIALQQEFNFPQRKAEDRVAQMLNAAEGGAPAIETTGSKPDNATVSEPVIAPTGSSPVNN